MLIDVSMKIPEDPSCSHELQLGIGYRQRTPLKGEKILNRPGNHEMNRPVLTGPFHAVIF
jgi:hypothetical protein